MRVSRTQQYEPANIVMFRRIFRYVGGRAYSFGKADLTGIARIIAYKCTHHQKAGACIMGRHMCSGPVKLRAKQIVDDPIGVSLDIGIDHRNANIYSRSV